VLPFLREGLLPNIFGNGPDDSAYDSADAALWFARAVLLYDRAGGDADLLHTQLLPALLAIAAAYRRGAPLGLKVDGDGLLEAGAGDKNATWMDARTAEGPVTPRDGQPVELNALWCSLLAHACELGWRFGELEGLGELELLHRRAAAAFPLRFWSGSAGHLADRVVAGKPDLTVRPNMVLAAALEFCPMTRSQRRGVVQKARAVLLTPRGLRTLAPGEPGYQGRYQGGPEQRDRAYHQGTAWPWLLGCYVEAALRAAEAAELPAVRQELRAVLDGFLPEVDRQGLNHVSEVFDGDAPQRGGGTFAQAWNTGELLRARALLASWPEALELRP
jgi:predicted glycogen debranching enzyme